MVSTRRSEGSNRSYRVGNKVEILRDNGIEIGTLQSMTKSGRYDSPAPGGGKRASSPYWMVALEGSPNPAEQQRVSEQMLGRILDATTTTSESDGSTVHIASSASAVVKNAAVPKASTTTKTVIVAAKVSKTRKASSSITSSEKKRQNAMKYRRVTTRAATRSAGPQVELFGGIDDIQLPKKQPPKPKKPIKKAPREDVLEVKLLTGTLYLYRGKTRRAEFVRTR